MNQSPRQDQVAGNRPMNTILDRTTDAKSTRQRNAIWKANGEPIVVLTFDGFTNGEVTMWQSVKHVDFNTVRQMLMKMREHLDRILKNERMCPFHPEFCNNDLLKRESHP